MDPPAAAQRRGGTTLTPTSGNPPSGGEEGPEPNAKPCRRSSEDAKHASFNHRGTIAASRMCCDHQQNPPFLLRDGPSGEPRRYARLTAYLRWVTCGEGMVSTTSRPVCPNSMQSIAECPRRGLGA